MQGQSGFDSEDIETIGDVALQQERERNYLEKLDLLNDNFDEQ